ncbi:MAG: hypothetical protein PUE01_11960 [Clostridiaceae bacterium]|nr:hypothetical protein [Clostridiaceae bacterium]
MINAIDFVKEHNLYLKVTTSTATFDNYNSFFNIYSEMDEPCRRVVVITPYSDLEEVNEVDKGQPIIKDRLIDNNLWLEEYPLTTVPSKIDLNKIVLSDEQVKLLLSIDK